ncbi:hypothetical protein COLO4_33481 [Corchorus olitorius]|uniref:Uncharacterized protein n=1 Tax=Corchorus olitorius TaxID=93759 RepID=A0A1R3GT47_9ROSI|nr:hypothetical protein COLO4_33481 [Corchorus olitorius]
MPRLEAQIAANSSKETEFVRLSQSTHLKTEFIKQKGYQGYHSKLNDKAEKVTLKAVIHVIKMQNRGNPVSLVKSERVEIWNLPAARRRDFEVEENGDGINPWKFGVVSMVGFPRSERRSGLRVVSVEAFLEGIQRRQGQIRGESKEKSRSAFFGPHQSSVEAPTRQFAEAQAVATILGRLKGGG